MVNFSGAIASLSAITNPTVLLPRLVVKDIRQLDWTKLKMNGVTGIVIDQDNCITKPGVETLVPTLQSSWDDCLTTFGSQNVLIVSNSAGTKKDPLLLQAETLSRNLHVPVLIHTAPKPSPACALSVTHYFAPLPPPPLPSTSRIGRWLDTRRSKRYEELKGAVVWNTRKRDGERFGGQAQARRSDKDDVVLLVIGDRISTDTVLASRLDRMPLPSSANASSSQSTIQSPRSGRIRAISVLTTSLHARESIGTTILRSIEKGILRINREKMISRNEADLNRWEACLHSSSPSTPLTPSNVSLAHRLAYLSTLLQDAYASFVQSSSPDRWNPETKWRSLFEHAERAMATRVVNPAEKELVKGVERVREVRQRLRGWI